MKKYKKSTIGRWYQLKEKSRGKAEEIRIRIFYRQTVNRAHDHLRKIGEALNIQLAKTKEDIVKAFSNVKK